MAYIRVIDENEAEGDLFRVYDEIQRSRGRLSNILRSQSLDPRGLKVHLDLYLELIYGKGPLSRRERELVAVVVSAANDCKYCVVHHSEALSKYVKDEAEVRQIGQDYTKVKLPARERALADYAHGLTLRPNEGREQAFAALRKAGFRDEEVLHATQITAYFNFANRIVQGLGVDLEQTEARDYAY